MVGEGSSAQWGLRQRVCVRLPLTPPGLCAGRSGAPAYHDQGPARPEPWPAAAPRWDTRDARQPRRLRDRGTGQRERGNAGGAVRRKAWDRPARRRHSDRRRAGRRWTNAHIARTEMVGGLPAATVRAPPAPAPTQAPTEIAYEILRMRLQRPRARPADEPLHLAAAATLLVARDGGRPAHEQATQTPSNPSSHPFSESCRCPNRRMPEPRFRCASTHAHRPQLGEAHGRGGRR